MKKFFALIVFTLTAASLIAAPQVIVFDFGGVLAGKPNREVVVTFLQQSFHLSGEEFEKIYQEKLLTIKEGKTDEEFWLSYAKNKKITLPSNWTSSFREVIKEAIGVNPKMYALVHQLKEQKIPVALFSNVNERLAAFIRDSGFYEPFDLCILSCEIGIEKPDPKAYELLLKKLKLPANDVFFVDDRVENVEAAKKLGLDAILFESEQQMRTELHKRGIL